MKKAAEVCCFLVGLMALVSAFIPAQVDGKSLIAAGLTFGLLANALKD